MSEHEVIWLQPTCEGCNGEEGRLWCQDDVGPCDECSKPWIKYVLEARAFKAEAECAELGEAMRQVGIAQFEANAARQKAEEALREIIRQNDTTPGAALAASIARAALSEKAP